MTIKDDIKLESALAIERQWCKDMHIDKQKVRDAIKKECDCYTGDEDYICSACRIKEELGL